MRLAARQTAARAQHGSPALCASAARNVSQQPHPLSLTREGITRARSSPSPRLALFKRSAGRSDHERERVVRRAARRTRRRCLAARARARDDSPKRVSRRARRVFSRALTFRRTCALRPVSSSYDRHEEPGGTNHDESVPRRSAIETSKTPGVFGGCNTNQNHRETFSGEAKHSSSTRPRKARS
jgi:hypothetical protein